MDELTKKLAEFAAKTDCDDLPEEVIRETKRLLLDSIGCGIAGHRTERGRICAQLAKTLAGQPESSILGTTVKVSSTNAAFANGELINALDYDACCSAHIPPFILPAPLALAEASSAAGQELIASIALGMEIGRRIGLATRPRHWPTESGPEKGNVVFAPVSGQGAAVFGAAVGAGKILHLDFEKMASAIGVAGYAGPPNTFRKWTDTAPVSMTKYGPPGFAADVGVRAALLADMGYRGDTDIFEGEFNYWRFAGYQEWDRKKVTENLGHKWQCLEVKYKKFPCGY